MKSLLEEVRHLHFSVLAEHRNGSSCEPFENPQVKVFLAWFWEHALTFVFQKSLMLNGTSLEQPFFLKVGRHQVREGEQGPSRDQRLAE